MTYYRKESLRSSWIPPQYGGFVPSALIAFAFSLVFPDEALFIDTVLAGILAIVLMAPGTVPDLFPPAFSLVFTDQPLFAPTFSAVATLVVSAHFD